VLLRTSHSYHRTPETMAQISLVPGDHFTMMRPPHVDAVAEIMHEMLAAFKTSSGPAPILGSNPVPLSQVASAASGHAED
jgi:hypothetical protein